MTGPELLAGGEPGRVARARGERGPADGGQPGQRPGQLGRAGLAVAAFAFGGVGGQPGADGAQQPDLGGDLGGEAGEVDGGVAAVELQGGAGGLEPLAGASGAQVVIRGLGDHRGQLILPGPGKGTRVGVAFQDGQAGGAGVPAQRAERQQLAGQVPDPLLVPGALPGEPVGGADPPVQRGPVSAGQRQRGQPGRAGQRQPGQGAGVDAVGLGVPGQEPAQVSGLLRGNPEHRAAAAGEEHRDRQPRRAGRLDHHLQPGAVRAAGQRRRLHRGQALHRGPGPAPGHDGALPVQHDRDQQHQPEPGSGPVLQSRFVIEGQIDRGVTGVGVRSTGPTDRPARPGVGERSPGWTARCSKSFSAICFLESSGSGGFTASAIPLR